MFLHRLSLDTCPLHPSRNRPLINAECHDDRLEGTAVRQQGHDVRDARDEVPDPGDAALLEMAQRSGAFWSRSIPLSSTAL